MDVIVSISDFLWGNFIGYALLVLGLLFSILLVFPQIRYFGHALSVVRNSLSGDGGKISGFSTLMASIGSQVGTGSLVGVSSALAAGGPGAIFWMWVTAAFGMVITFCETVLGQLFRERQEDGTYRGGAAYYIEKGLRNRAVAIVIAVLYILGVGIAIASVQTSSIANAVTGVTDINPLIPGLIVIALAGLVTIGGAKRLASVSNLIVPFMAVGYISIVTFIVLINITNLPAVIILIAESAFSPAATLGGVGGWTIMEAFRHGMTRGLFSNDAGNGAAAMMHAAADVKHPVQQGLLGMIGTFVTTILICSATAFAILMTGVISTGEDGINLLQEAFNSGIGDTGRWMILGAMFLFGFTTLLADLFYGETNIRFIFRDKAKWPIWVYRLVGAIILAIAAVVPLNFIWAFVDFFMAFIVFINLCAIILLFKYVKRVFDDYVRQRKAGVSQPVWDYSEEQEMKE
ncbi:MAG: alanine/glycine:cation symporter family protein [Corynebacterium sp.]|uniref:alanine/glycine:cation symporter family protein n=1 Tax=unclassified Corynebacterium TaxID=2624378 RepID=UPI00095E61B9|nr:sodium:alanine symporter family protein [Corynebacterium sp. CNJ-954]OLT53450.1 sodium:alanine symporter [Corynebacterium sp. CNJ-954]